jgi:hypothetical protein
MPLKCLWAFTTWQSLERTKYNTQESWKFIMCSYFAIISFHLPGLVECDCFVHCVISSSATRGLVHHMANDCCWICIFKPLVEEIRQIELGIWDEFISMGIMKVAVGWTLWESLFVVWSLWNIKVLCSNGFGHMDINIYGWTQFW